jgi:hypothetical protein
MDVRVTGYTGVDGQGAAQRHAGTHWRTCSLQVRAPARECLPQNQETAVSRKRPFRRRRLRSARRRMTATSRRMNPTRAPSLRASSPPCDTIAREAPPAARRA